jgi:hypothetical protein
MRVFVRVFGQAFLVPVTAGSVFFPTDFLKTKNKKQHSQPRARKALGANPKKPGFDRAERAFSWAFLRVQ